MARPRKNEATPATAVINSGNWSSTTPVVPMHYMHIEIEWLEKALGTSPNNSNLLGDYIASKAPDAKSKEEEIEAIGKEEVMDKQICVYPKGKFRYNPTTGRYLDDMTDSNKLLDGEEVRDNVPYYYNYQIRGFFKDSCGLLTKGDDVDEAGKKVGSTESAKLKAYKKVIDGCIFVFPRRIAIDIPEYYLDDDGFTMLPSRNEDGSLKVIQRPIRISGPSGERVAIAASEMIPAGSRMKFTIGMTSLKFKPAIVEWLNYAVVHGISGWRNSGIGICRWREIKEDYTPYTEI